MMKNFLQIIGILILTFCSSIGMAKVGCIDNSYHLEEKPDFKTYHYVACTCPCDKYRQLDKRGRCLQCKHFHAPASPIYIK